MSIPTNNLSEKEKKAKITLIKKNDKKLVTTHRNTLKAKDEIIQLDYLEMILKGEAIIFTRTDQIKEFPKRQARKSGKNLLRVIEEAVKWKVNKKVSNKNIDEFKKTLLYVLGLDELWASQLLPKNECDGYIRKTKMDKDEIL